MTRFENSEGNKVETETEEDENKTRTRFRKIEVKSKEEVSSEDDEKYEMFLKNYLKNCKRFRQAKQTDM